MQTFRERFFLYSFFVLIITTFLLVLYMLSPFWQPITLALISAVVFYPVHRFLRKILFSEFLAAVLTLIVVFSLVIVPLTLAAFVLGQEIAKLVSKINEYYQTGKFDLLIQNLKSQLYIYLYKFQVQYPFLGEVLKEENLREILKNLYSTLSGGFTKLTKVALFWVGNTAFATFIYLMTLFFSLYQGKIALKHLRNIMPLEEKDKEEVLETLYNAITGVIYGTVGTAIVQSFIALGLYIYYGLSYPFLWAVVTALFAFVPPFGTGYVWFPLTLYELLFVNHTKGLIGLTVGFLVISSIDNFVRPLVMKEKIELPYIFLFFAVLGGLFVFGFTGLFLGPTIFALFITLLKLYEQKFSR